MLLTRGCGKRSVGLSRRDVGFQMQRNTVKACDRQGGGTVRRNLIVALGAALVVSASAYALDQPTAQAPAATDRVDLEMMTWVELKAAIDRGKTTALVFNGGTETRGPQAVNGGHTFVAHAKVVAIARALGNAIAAPVLPFSPNNGAADLPGTIGITPDTYKEVNKEVVEQLIRNGFKNVVLMGDHGGGQKQLAEAATELDTKYAGQGIRVVYCEDAYKKSNADFDAWLASQGYSPGGHASVNDTSEMMYLEPAPDAWVRRDKLAEAVGTGRHHGADATNSASSATEPGPPSNGVFGDGRRSSAELGKYGYEIHVDEAVKQIKQLLGE